MKFEKIKFLFHDCEVALRCRCGPRFYSSVRNFQISGNSTTSSILRR